MGLKLAVACGGTGGHAFPGIAAAKELASRGHEVTVWMSGRDVESSVLKDWSGSVFATGAKQLTLKNALGNLCSIWRCRKEMRRMKPDALLAMGSYSSLPPVLAAAGRRVPVVLHEANTVPGRAVDLLSSLAKAVAVSFAETACHFPKKDTFVTGLPVRADIVGQPRLDDVPEDAFCVFVTGGSQGAHRVNEIASKAIAILGKELDKIGKKLHVIHQTGAKDAEWVKESYEKAGIPARVNAFEYEMGRAMSTADVVVARAGASTCFELSLTGRPAFFIPLPSAMRNHQHYNAAVFASKLAAVEGVQEDLTPGALSKWLFHKATHPDSLSDMASNMKSMAMPDAASRVADLVERIAKGDRSNG